MNSVAARRISPEGEVIDVKSPLDGSKIGEVPVVTIEESLDRLSRARAAQARWWALAFDERRAVVERMLETLFRRQDEMAGLLTRETGKTTYEAEVFEIVPLLHLGGYFAKNAGKILGPRKISVSVFKNRASYIHYKPRGVMMVISPWNFPLSIAGGEIIMGLLAGNAVLHKPASLTPLSALKFREMFDQAGLDRDVFQVITGPGSLASEIIEQGDLDYVNFTGSTAVGREVAAVCGRKLIPYSLELGGKDPAIVLPDADVETAAKAIVWGAFANSGQICASVERAYVHEDLYDKFLDKVTQITNTLRQGNPLTDDVDIGSMTDPAQIDVVEKHLADSIANGARVMTGGKRNGMFFEPTVIADATDETPNVCTQTFGPLLPIIKYRREEDAIKRANGCRYGLNAYVFTRDQAHGRRVAEQLEAGTVMINDTLMTHAFPETPWQGVKESGIGRVHSDDGLRDLAQGYHVNYEVFSMENPVWYPYSETKARRILAAAELLHRKSPVTEKLRALKAVVTGKTGEA